MSFAAELIYDGRLRSGVTASDRPPVAGFGWPDPRVPVAFVEVPPQPQPQPQPPGRRRGASGEWTDGESKRNDNEVARLVAVLETVLDAGRDGGEAVAPAEVGVVTPYTAQVRTLRQQWHALCRRRATQAGGGGDGGVGWWSAPQLLEIASVDNFQGREKELILFSAVRCNRAGRLGFLSDWRRLNVLLTRARRGLVVFGNAATLRHDTLWSEWLDWSVRVAAAAPLLAHSRRATLQVRAPPRNCRPGGPC
eukprot:SAG11_NODE_133_length_15400_cov_10.132344_2_plen_251_part_00